MTAIYSIDSDGSQEAAPCKRGTDTYIYPIRVHLLENVTLHTPLCEDPRYLLYRDYLISVIFIAVDLFLLFSTGNGSVSSQPIVTTGPPPGCPLIPARIYEGRWSMTLDTLPLAKHLHSAAQSTNTPKPGSRDDEFHPLSSSPLLPGSALPPLEAPCHNSKRHDREDAHHNADSNGGVPTQPPMPGWLRCWFVACLSLSLS